jgi:hypothetical protein
MKFFNAFQIVAAFVAWPFLISWLTTAEFRGAGVAFYAACALYVVAFGLMTISVAESIDKD